MKSAYFPGSEENSSVTQSINHQKAQPQQSHYSLGSEHRATGISFPFNKSVLWNREVVSFPVYLNAVDMMPALFLSPADITSLLRQLTGSTNANNECLVHVSHYNHLSEEQKVLIGAPFLGLPKYLFAANTGAVRPEATLTIPLAFKDPNHEQILFEESSTTNLIQNLGKSIRSSREFALKSCLRVRAAGYAQRTSAFGQEGAGEALAGTVRFEAILPNVSFQMAQIKPIPILSTPLSNQLVRRSSHVDGPPRLGYLTMNQTRKLVMLQENDPSVPLVPLVGLWVRFSVDWVEALGQGQGGEGGLIDHPYCWAACVRFLNADSIQQRAMVASGTFLLALVLADQVQYFEVTKLPPSDLDGEPGTEYVCCDFTVDLSVDVAAGAGGPGEAVVCRFRPMSGTHHIEAFHSALQEHPQQYQYSRRPLATLSVPFESATGASDGAEASSLPAPRPMLTCPQPMDLPVSPGQKSRSPPQPPSQPLQSKPPQPYSLRASQTLPLRASVDRGTTSTQSAPGSFSSLIREARGREGDANSCRNSVSSGVGAGIEVVGGGQDSPGVTYPADIILAQQRQLSSLRTQVEELRRMVVRLGGTPPAGAGRGLSKGTGVSVSVDVGVGVGAGVGFGEAVSVADSLNVDVLDATYTEPFDEDLGERTFAGLGAGTGGIGTGTGVSVSVDASSLSVAEEDGAGAYAEDDEYVATAEEEAGLLLGSSFDAKWGAYVQELAPTSAGLRRKVNPLDAMVPKIPSIQSRAVGRSWDSDVEASYVHPNRDEEPEDEEEEEAFQYRRTSTSASTSASAGASRAAKRVGSSNTSTVQYGRGPGFNPPPVSAFGSRIHSEDPSAVYESESILAIEARYLSQRF
ncbi:SCL-interrupting locus protein N-terminus-domain-containing protein [Ochromonadaceae sp. CCMP2298]|nr:SCL-interrupting locus protein N-terminus-domain-containing protein [Ochromonadaceae sp. CCMP2298]